MAKSSEWGAAAYLGDSKYGTNGIAITKNSTSCITGGSSTINTIYTTNKTQSTTLNATGIYDMRGGATELVASYVYYSSSSNLKDYGGTSSGDLFGATENEQKTSSAYKTVYTDYSSEMKGDAIYETSTSSSSSTGSWYDACAVYPDSDEPFVARGGYYGSKHDGSFFFYGSYGGVGDHGSFRPVLAF
jgi:formylglycine-generating enzyme required for sulfatase activity